MTTHHDIRRAALDLLAELARVDAHLGAASLMEQARDLAVAAERETAPAEVLEDRLTDLMRACWRLGGTRAATDRYYAEAPGIAAILCAQCARVRAHYTAAGTVEPNAGTADPMAGRFHVGQPDGSDLVVSDEVTCACGHRAPLPPAEAVEALLADEDGQ